MNAVAEQIENEFLGTATYSPEDNKIRFYPFARLSTEDYKTITETGFKWAPRQELFVAPMWTPARARLMEKWCGDIGDEDTSLVERAEERAERFEEYSEKRGHEAERTHNAVSTLADGIPLGQPILIGHHSERRARKDAEKIEKGLEKAARLWETSSYWTRRAAGALRQAKYKEQPDVRARRIKTLEADERKFKKEIATRNTLIKMWNSPDKELTLDRAKAIANMQTSVTWGIWGKLDTGVVTPEQARTESVQYMQNAIETHYEPWLQHTQNRLAYERAMLEETGGLAADQYDLQIGGRILARREWVTITKINKSNGRIASVSTNARYGRVIPYEEIQGYEPPAEGSAEAVKAAKKLPPLVNVRTDGCIELTQAEWKRKPGDYKSCRVVKGTDTHGPYRQRTAFQANRGYSLAPVFITDLKETPLPPPAQSPVAAIPAPEPLTPVGRPQPYSEDAAEAKARALREQLKGGVQVVTANQLFPTPPDLAKRMAAFACPTPQSRFADFSAGTGNLLQAFLDEIGELPTHTPWLVEINSRLSDLLHGKFPMAYTLHADFLEHEFIEANKFDVILLNPPFENAVDIKHINKAASLLAPGGRLVAICANGPRQRAQLMPIAAHWEDLPAGTFAQQGTGVNTALLVIQKR